MELFSYKQKNKELNKALRELREFTPMGRFVNKFEADVENLIWGVSVGQDKEIRFDGIIKKIK